MRKILIVLTMMGISTTFAMTKVDLSQQKFTCKGIKLTDKTTSAIISQNCKNVKVKTDKQITSGHNAGNLRGSNLIEEDDINPTVATLQKVSFYTDDSSHLKCYYRNDRLYKCKAKKTKLNSSQIK